VLNKHKSCGNRFELLCFEGISLGICEVFLGIDNFAGSVILLVDNTGLSGHNPSPVGTAQLM